MTVNAYYKVEENILILEIKAKFIKNNQGKMLSFDDIDKPISKNNGLIISLKKAFEWRAEMEKKHLTFTKLAKLKKIDEATIAKTINLTYLAPDIIESIVKGQQPICLGIKKLMANVFPNDWDEQRTLLGF